MSVAVAIERLQTLLPLQQRQQALPRRWAVLQTGFFRPLVRAWNIPVTV